MDPDAPILFFDSGVGGLSVLGPTLRAAAECADRLCRRQRRLSLRQASDAEIASRVPALLGRLVERFHPRFAVIACNTASTIALDHVRSALDLPVVGTVPAIKPAAEMSKSRVIGVLGTEATVRQPYVDDLAARFASDCTIIRHGSPELVELAEAKLRGEDVGVDAVRAAAQPMFDAPGGERIDTVVLACTHFPLLERRAARRLSRSRIMSTAGRASRAALHGSPASQAWPDRAVRRADAVSRSAAGRHRWPPSPATASARSKTL